MNLTFSIYFQRGNCRTKGGGDKGSGGPGDERNRAHTTAASITTGGDREENGLKSTGRRAGMGNGKGRHRQDEGLAWTAGRETTRVVFKSTRVVSGKHPRCFRKAPWWFPLLPGAPTLRYHRFRPFRCARAPFPAPFLPRPPDRGQSIATGEITGQSRAKCTQKRTRIWYNLRHGENT